MQHPIVFITYSIATDGANDDRPTVRPPNRDSDTVYLLCRAITMYVAELGDSTAFYSFFRYTMMLTRYVKSTENKRIPFIELHAVKISLRYYGKDGKMNRAT